MVGATVESAISRGAPIELTDWVLIEELRGLNPATRLERLRALGDESADALRPSGIRASRSPSIAAIRTEAGSRAFATT
jgi:hypothetical protein